MKLNLLTLINFLLISNFSLGIELFSINMALLGTKLTNQTESVITIIDNQSRQTILNKLENTFFHLDEITNIDQYNPTKYINISIDENIYRVYLSGNIKKEIMIVNLKNTYIGFDPSTTCLDEIEETIN